MHRFVVSAIVFLAIGMLAGLPQTARAAESYDNCTGFITSVPAVISTQGTWCLKNDLSTALTGIVAIKVNTNNVTIDCNDFKLGGTAGGMGTGSLGIVAEGRSNVTVRHCNVRGFMYGISFAGAGGGGHVIEDNRLDGNTDYAIVVEGDGSVIRRNLILNTGGSTLDNTAAAILTTYSVDILDNTISKVWSAGISGGTVIGIETQYNESGSISGNRVRGLLPVGWSYDAWAIYNVSSDRLTMRGNDLVGNGSSSGIGVRCQDSHGVAMNNVISAFNNSIASCTDGGGNVIAP